MKTNSGGEKRNEGKPSPLALLRAALYGTPEGLKVLEGLQSLIEDETPLATIEEYEQTAPSVEYPVYMTNSLAEDFKPAFNEAVNQGYFGMHFKGYDRGNWLKGLNYSWLADALLRHFIKFYF